MTHLSRVRGKASTGLASSPDGRRLATASADAMARCWRVPAPVAGDVERIACWVRVTTGREFDVPFYLPNR
jgi:hypothetical protein